MTGVDVRAAVLQVLGTSGDVDMIDYCVSMLEDEDFEWGEDCEDAAENLGPFMVGC